MNARLTLIGIALLAACSSHTRGEGTVPPDAPDAAPATLHPIVVVDTFTTLYAVSDVHGHLDELVALLTRYGLASFSGDPRAIAWTGGDATLVIAGDMIDKGPRSLEVVEAAMALQASAPSSGGKVIVLFGNHEAELLGDPLGSKFQGSDRIDDELAAQSPAVDPVKFAAGDDPRGRWLRALPFGAKVGDFFFAHAGDTAGLSVDAIDASLLAALASPAGWNADAITGSASIVESRGWYSDAAVVTRNAAALGVRHIAFGHDPNAFGSSGQMVAPSSYGGALVKLDTGLGAGDSQGALLRVRREGATEIGEALTPDGAVVTLFHDPP